MSNRLYLPVIQAFDPVTGAIIPGAKLYCYEAGSSTPKNTYNDADLDVSHVNTNPVVADSGGFFPDIFLEATGNYKFLLKTSADVTVWTRDNFAAFAGATVASQAEVDARVLTNKYVAPATIAEGVGLQGASIASATALDLPAIGDYFVVTGTTQIESIETRTAGREITLKFDGALTLKHNATSLILPSAADVTTAAGDVAVFRSEGSGNWRCVTYQRASGGSVAASANAGTWVLINTFSPSAAASQAVTGFDATKYSDYLIMVDHLAPATDNVDLYLRTSTDAGATYDSGASDYAYAAQRFLGGGSGAGGDSSAGAAQISLTVDVSVGNASNEDVSGEIKIINPGATARCCVMWTMDGLNDGGTYWHADGKARRLASADVNAVQFLFSSGNIASGTIRLYGLRI